MRFHYTYFSDYNKDNFSNTLAKIVSMCSEIKIKIDSKKYILYCYVDSTKSLDYQICFHDNNYFLNIIDRIDNNKITKLCILDPDNIYIEAISECIYGLNLKSLRAESMHINYLSKYLDFNKIDNINIGHNKMRYKFNNNNNNRILFRSLIFDSNFNSIFTKILEEKIIIDTLHLTTDDDWSQINLNCKLLLQCINKGLVRLVDICLTHINPDIINVFLTLYRSKIKRLKITIIDTLLPCCDDDIYMIQSVLNKCDLVELELCCDYDFIIAQLFPHNNLTKLIISTKYCHKINKLLCNYISKINITHLELYYHSNIKKKSVMSSIKSIYNDLSKADRLIKIINNHQYLKSVNLLIPMDKDHRPYLKIVNPNLEKFFMGNKIENDNIFNIENSFVVNNPNIKYFNISHTNNRIRFGSFDLLCGNYGSHDANINNILHKRIKNSIII
jgi:hypothetical protein